ncbi:hypothetical protein [Lacimicrobium alkaliphilum]|uniref:hypothetical protein n=1 Tax=Lacimicrobium alkaliphilum TaxID=1526571 RepID=UPI0012E3849D|nr:hypothetical protein [Lacimicrobium alkaliphilum]
MAIREYFATGAGFPLPLQPVIQTTVVNTTVACQWMLLSAGCSPLLVAATN